MSRKAKRLVEEKQWASKLQPRGSWKEEGAVFSSLDLGSSESSCLQLCICSLCLATLDYVNKDITIISQCYQLTYYLFTKKLLDLVQHDTTKRKMSHTRLLPQARTKE